MVRFFLMICGKLKRQNERQVNKMTKCDFCTKFHNGKCYWLSTLCAESDCKKAIELMTRALRGVGIKAGGKNKNRI